MGILKKISRSARNSYAPLALRCGGQQFFFLTRPTIGDKPRKTRKTWTFWKKPIFRRSDFGHVHISGMVRADNYLFISCIYPSPIWYNTKGVSRLVGEEGVQNPRQQKLKSQRGPPCYFENPYQPKPIFEKWTFLSLILYLGMKVYWSHPKTKFWAGTLTSGYQKPHFWDPIWP